MTNSPMLCPAAPQAKGCGIFLSTSFSHAAMMTPSRVRNSARSLRTLYFVGSAKSGALVQVRPSSVLRSTFFASRQSTPPSVVVTNGP